MRQFKVIVEKHPDGYVAYPLGLKGIVVGEGDTYEEALTDVTTPYGYKPRASGMTPVCRPIPLVRFMPMSEAKLKTTHALHGTICSHGSVFTSGPSPENPYTI
jgi:hypothetical protein